MLDRCGPELKGDLFGPDALLCVGMPMRPFYSGTIAELSEQCDLTKLAQIVPHRLTARTGYTKEGILSEHSLENTGPRCYDIIEFDPASWDSLTGRERDLWQGKDEYIQLKKDEQAAIISYLARFSPLSLVVDSGGKSLQAWFSSRGGDKESCRPFNQRACELGADKAFLNNRSQFCRMPEGTRATGERQHVIYFDPTAKTLTPVPSLP
jgi:hypothetical protein